MTDFFRAILFLNYGLLLCVIIWGAARYRILNHKEKQYFYCIAFLFFIELLNLILPYVFKMDDTSFIYPFYIAGEFFLLSTLFIRKLDVSRYFVGLSGLLAVGFMVAKYAFNYPFNSDIAKVVSNIMIVCLSGFILIREIRGAAAQNRFLLVDASIFFYYSVSVFFFIIQHQLANLSEDDFYFMLSINNILLSILYCSFIYTFIKLKK